MLIMNKIRSLVKEIKEIREIKVFGGLALYPRLTRFQGLRFEIKNLADRLELLELSAPTHPPSSIYGLDGEPLPVPQMLGSSRYEGEKENTNARFPPRDTSLNILYTEVPGKVADSTFRICRLTLHSRNGSLVLSTSVAGRPRQYVLSYSFVKKLL